MSEDKQTKGGILFVITAGICWGIISLFVNSLSRAGFDTLSIVAMRTWCASILMFLYLLIFKRKLLKIDLKDIWMFVGTGVLSLTFFTYCYFTSIIETGAAVAVVLLYTSPIFVMVMSAVFFKEKITSTRIVAIFLTFLGCVLITGLIGSSDKLSFRGILLGLGAGFGYALYSIFGGYAVKKYSSLTISFYTFVLCGIAMLFIYPPGKVAALAKGTLGASPAGKGAVTVILLVVGISLICTVIPYITYTIGLARMEKSKAAVLVTIEPLVGTLIGFILFGENINLFKVLGILMIFAAIIISGRE